MPAPVPALFGLDGWADKAALIGVVAAAAVVALALIGLVTPRLARRAGRVDDPSKWQQRRTAVTLLATMLRYLVVVVGIAAVVAILAGAGGIGALGGSAVVAVTIGFASQRLLTDVIAGFFILFEGQYAVGDTIAVEPSKIVGVVEELGVRTTVIRELDGSHTYVPNGQITAVRRFAAPQTALALSMVTRDGDAAIAAVQDLGKLAGPTHGLVGAVGNVTCDAVGGDVSLVRATIGASATLVATAQGIVVATLKARLADALIDEPIITPVERTRSLTTPVSPE